MRVLEPVFLYVPSCSHWDYRYLLGLRFFDNIYLYNLMCVVCVHTHAHKHTYMLWCVFGDPRITYRTWFSPSIMSVLGIKLSIHSYCQPLARFLQGFWDLNSGPHTYKVIAVLNELLSLQASSSILVVCLPVLSVWTQYIATLHSCYCVL